MHTGRPAGGREDILAEIFFKSSLELNSIRIDDYTFNLKKKSDSTSDGIRVQHAKES